MTLVAVVIGASRGIGRQIAITLAQNGYTVIVAAKSSSPSSTSSSSTSPFPPDPNSQASTIDTVVREITETGAIAFAYPVNVRSNTSITNLITQVLHHHNKIDILIY